MAARSECLGPPIPSAPDRGLFVRVILGRNPTIPRTIKARSPHYLYVERIYSRESRYPLRGGSRSENAMMTC